MSQPANTAHIHAHASAALDGKPLTEEEKAPPSSFSTNGTNRSTEALRAVVADLRALGVRDPAERLREAAVKIGGRVLDACRTDPSKSARWAEAVLRDGASMLREPGPQLTALDRRRIASFDALYLDRTGDEWPGA